MQKRVISINSLACYGRMAMTVALPVISAAGAECCVLPTTVLSTHLAYPNPAGISMTDMIGPITRHLKSLNVEFDAILTGYIDSSAQIGLIANLIEGFKTADNFVLVDPAMADNGKMYSNPEFNCEFVDKMRALCQVADIVTPNITEAAFICGIPFLNPPHSKDYIEGLLKALCGLGPSKAVLTGVVFTEEEIGSAAFDKAYGKISYSKAKKFEGRYIGTGDLFAAVFAAALLNGFDIHKASEIAVSHVSYCIGKSQAVNTKDSIAINFEQCMGKLIERLGV